MQSMSLSVTPEEAEIVFSLRRMHAASKARVLRLILRLREPETDQREIGGVG